jgi:aspartate aminotransferase
VVGADSSFHYGIREIGALAARLPDAIRLEIGDPWFPTPAHIAEAAAAAVAEGFTHYTPSAGLDSLRELIAEKLRCSNGVDCGPNQVIVTTGGTGALFTALLELLEPGDEVLIPDPAWPYYQAMVCMLRGRPVPYPLERRRAFEPDPDDLERRITARTKVLIVNSPGNPSGAVFPRELMAALAELAERRGLWLISDECYDALVFDGEHVSMATLTSSERLLSVFSFSKAYAMTGWRVGYLVGAAEVVAAIARTQESVVVNASSVSQKAAEAALAGPQDQLEDMRLYYRRQRDTAAALLDAAGVGYVRPLGAFYMMIELPPGLDAPAFAQSLLDRRHVAVAPGPFFGSTGEGLFRISLCGGGDDLERGVQRIVEELAAHRGPAERVASTAS